MRTYRKLLLAAALCSTMAGNAAFAQSAPAEHPLGSSWADVTAMPDFFTGNWQSRTTFLDHPSDVLLTPEAQEYVAQYQPIEDIPFAGPGCPTPGMPIVQRLGSPLKFFYEPGLIAIYIENSSLTRFIRLNQPLPTEEPNPSFLGTSVGHFEGDTLVVESIGFDRTLMQYANLPGQGTGDFVLPPEVVFGPHGPNLKLVERMRLLDSERLEIRLTVYDDTIWTAPYESRPLQLFIRNRGEHGQPHEWVCSSVPDPIEYSTSDNSSVMEDPAVVLQRIIESEGRH